MNLDPTNEPITRTEAWRLLFVAALALPQAFGLVSFSPDQLASLLGLFAAVSVVMSVHARSKSTPTSKVALTTDQMEELNRRPPIQYSHTHEPIPPGQWKP